MKKILLIFALILSANSLEIESLRTELYSKSGANVLKKIELSLEFEGENLEAKKSQLIDSINTVISGFFYEDIFTESGKNNFKKTLGKFVQKKYKFKVDEIYILSLSGIEKFDLEEFKKFLQSTEAKEKNTQDTLKKILDSVETSAESSTKINEAQIPALNKTPQTPATPQIPQNLFTDEKENENNTDINFENLDTPKITPETQEKIKRDLIENLNKNKNLEQNGSDLKRNLESNLSLKQNLTGYLLNFDGNKSDTGI